MKGTAYLLQATLILLWWLGLSVNQEFYNAFQFPQIGSLAFNSFLLPDIIVIALLSILHAYTSKKGLGYIILGGFAFATLYCINASSITKGGYLSTTVMLLGLCYNIFLVYQDQMFRESDSTNIWMNGSKTFFQILSVWTITLVVFPFFILKSFGIPFEFQSNTKSIGIVVFALFSLLGLYSAFTLVKFGSGTPLPLDQTNRLVTKGPYNYVRNPMAIAGLGQGMAVAILFASWHIVVYTILGAVLWQLVVRPLEENNMHKRFGKDYLAYKKRISCWIPTLAKR